MAKGYKVCKVCGRQYEYCTTERRADLFRWQDVACCPEHGAVYFKKILASRETVRDEQTDSVVTSAANTQELPKKRTRKKKTEPNTTVNEKEMA